MSDMNTPIVYHFIALGKPQPLRRARYTRRGKFPHAYDPAENVNAKGSLLVQAMAHAPAEPHTGAVALTISFVMPRPKDHYGTGKNAGVLKPRVADVSHTSKPDLDNMVKLVKDALTGVFWRDDSQIDALDARKSYGDMPRTEVFIDAY